MLVQIVEPERMNLLGLILRGPIERALAAGRKPPQRGEIVVGASGMQVTLRFDRGRVEITRAPPRGRPTALVRGTLASLCDCVLGRNRVRAWLSGKLRVRGWPWTLWRLLGLFRVGPS